MPHAVQTIPLAPILRIAVERFLNRSCFAARTLESYAQDLRPLLARIWDQPVQALTHDAATHFMGMQVHLSATTYNRRYTALRSLVRWCMAQNWLDDDPLVGLKRRDQPRGDPRALDPERVEAVLRGIYDVRDRALFWFMYDGGLRCREALAVNVEDIDWAERCVRIQGKGGKTREMFFSRRVARYLDDYLKARGEPSVGALCITYRPARAPRRADVTADGYARLSYRQADTLWKAYSPGWDLHQLRHTAITTRAAHGYTEVEFKKFFGHASLRSLEIYIAHNREPAKRKAHEWERRDGVSE